MSRPTWVLCDDNRPKQQHELRPKDRPRYQCQEGDTEWTPVRDGGTTCPSTASETGATSAATRPA